MSFRIIQMASHPGSLLPQQGPFFYWFSQFCAGRISYLLLGPQHLQLSLPACSIGPTKLC